MVLLRSLPITRLHCNCLPDRTLPITTGCTFAPLRRRSRLRDTLGPSDCSVLLYSCGEAFGYSSLAQGDWDGFPDIDLLVVAANQDAAERLPIN